MVSYGAAGEGPAKGKEIDKEAQWSMRGARWRLEADFPVTRRAASAARRLLDQLLTVWDQDRLAEDARLVISELVTNAIRHAPNGGDLHLDIHGDQDGTLYLAVRDGSASIPRPRGTGADDELGRGLQIVQQLTTRWGVQTTSGVGKQVWVELEKPLLTPPTGPQ